MDPGRPPTTLFKPNQKKGEIRLPQTLKSTSKGWNTQILLGTRTPPESPGLVEPWTKVRLPLSMPSFHHRRPYLVDPLQRRVDTYFPLFWVSRLESGTLSGGAPDGSPLERWVGLGHLQFSRPLEHTVTSATLNSLYVARHPDTPFSVERICQLLSETLGVKPTNTRKLGPGPISATSVPQTGLG